MHPLRVLYLMNGFAVGGPVGGAERFTISLARALDRTKVTPMLAGLWQWDSPFEEQWRSELRAEGQVTLVGPPKDVDAPLQNLVGSIRALQTQITTPVDVIHSQCDFGDLVAWVLNRRLHAKALVRTAHNEREWAKRPWRRFVFTNVLYPLIYDVELGVSQKVVDNLDRRQLARMCRRRGIVAYNALDFERFSNIERVDLAARRRELGIPDNAYVVGTVSRLVRQKGIDVLLMAAGVVLAQRSDTYFVIVGDGELADTLREQARQLGIAERVFFAGARQNVEEILAVLDLFVSSSLWEGLPTVILEAMAARVPIVATRVSGTVELLEDAVTGILVPPGEPAPLAAAILTSAEKTEFGRAMAARAREHALARFDIRAVARQHEEIYRLLTLAA